MRSHFNPHSREGSDHPLPVHRTYRQISIHTPAKGVTRYGSKKILPVTDFNPHSREGSDDLPTRTVRRFGNFNPHSREGSDRCNSLLCRAWSDFNPHSREGSDKHWCGAYMQKNDFNPHSREGSDRTVLQSLCGLCRFQSTLPRRE